MVTEAAEVVGARSGSWSFARFADRWIYVFMAGLFFVTVLVGFLPDSVEILASVEAGRRPPLPLLMHFHAIVMGAWISLLLVQTTLMATGRGSQHRKLGLVAFVLVPAVLISMIGVVKATTVQIAAIPPGFAAPEAVSALKFTVSNILLEQIRTFLLFGCFVGWALYVRKTDSETHKRLLILATLMPLPAAIDRIAWLPTSIPESPLSLHLYMLLWLAPVLIYDLARRGHVHRAYVIGIAANLPFVVASHMLWGTPWWLATAPRIFGVPAW